MWNGQADLHLQRSCRSVITFSSFSCCPIWSSLDIEMASFLKKLTSKFFTHMTEAWYRKHRKYFLSPQTRVGTQSKEILWFESRFLCMYQQHIIKENSQFFLPQNFFILNYGKKKTLKIRGSFLCIFKVKLN